MRPSRRPNPPPAAADADADAGALFRAAVADARPLPPADRVVLTPPPPPALPLQSRRDEQDALAASLSDDIDVERLLETDADLSFRRPGIGPDVLRRLRRGQWVVQAELDLHGMRRDEARTALLAFIHHAQSRDRRCLRVIHGKGLSSPGREPVLKHKVRGWLVQLDAVLAFCQAGPADGGAGALLVLLRGRR